MIMGKESKIQLFTQLQFKNYEEDIRQRRYGIFDKRMSHVAGRFSCQSFGVMSAANDKNICDWKSKLRQSGY